MPALTAARAAVSRKAFAGRRLQRACANGSATFMSSKALWLPGADSPRLNPSYLDGSLPGCEQRKREDRLAQQEQISFRCERLLNSLWSESSRSIFSDTGFDPLGLADTPEALVRVVEGTACLFESYLLTLSDRSVSRSLSSSTAASRVRDARGSVVPRLLPHDMTTLPTRCDSLLTKF